MGLLQWSAGVFGHRLLVIYSKDGENVLQSLWIYSQLKVFASQVG